MIMNMHDDHPLMYVVRKKAFSKHILESPFSLMIFICRERGKS